MPGGGEKFLLDTKSNLSKDMGRPVTVTADVYLKDGEELDLDGIRMKVHGNMADIPQAVSAIISRREVLNLRGIPCSRNPWGRTDFPTGSMSTLVRSVKEKLFTLPEETVVYPGHGDNTTIGHEKKYNRFANRVLNSYNTEIYSGTERVISVPV